MKKAIFVLALLVSGIFINAQELTSKYKISFDGKDGTEITVSTEKLLEIGELRVAPTTAQIIAFNIEYTEAGLSKSLSAKSRTITKEMKEAISKMSAGDTFKITGIVLGEAKAIYSASDITVKIKLATE